ncbi:PREDICTED: rust resistance kinase Lr10-like [Ipomoea nil]|uniref:rust resistance kinase Lr10-like n=1 Tax=Ipomoea nil TaxID=35883 RepID=UPI0009014C55|nr:PREDICTED: rust resistance kinase Lr10-like [Ipomoea nil]
MKGYFLHLPILVLFLTLGYGYSYDRNECLPRKCGNNGPEISFPFRLKHIQPPECGYPGFELLCTDKGETALENPFPLLNATLQPPFPVKFLIESIDCEDRLIIISRVDGCFLQLLPILNLSASPFSFENLYNFSIFSCSTHRNITAGSINISPIACLTKPGHFIYAADSSLYLYSATDLISCTKMFHVSSVPYSIAQDNTVFSLRWTGPSCRLKNNSTAEDADDCIAPLTKLHTGPLRKLKVAGEVLGSFLVVVIVLVTYRIYRLNKMKKEEQVKIERFLEDYKALKPARYSYADIKKITDRFSEKLGEGSYGTVYKGKLSGDVFVAVKVLNNSKGDGDGEEFVNEMSTIGSIHHINVVRLVGYCADGFHRALVYEYLVNNSLEKFVFSPNDKNFLGWEKLQQIALGIAKGVEYLHQGCDQRILHFDIKPRNILLDQNFNPKISDFGQAKLCSKEKSIVSMTAARGTMGYIAPEVFSRNFGNVSYKSDVYSFGMLLLEMVGGKKKSDITGSPETNQDYFPEWIYNILSRGEEVEIQIEKGEDSKIAKKLTIVGLWCIQWYPVDRPSIKVVIQMLEAEEPPSMPPNPFTSTDPSKAKANKPGRLFTSALEIISEMD